MTEFSNWLAEILASFDGSDIFAFIGGCVTMVIYKNVKAAMWNRNSKSGVAKGLAGTGGKGGTSGQQILGRKVSLPKLNRKILIWFVVFASMIGIMWSTLATARYQRALALQTLNVALVVCENSKVSSVERRGLQNLFIAALDPPDDIEKLKTDDPKRVEWGEQVVTVYLNLLEDAQHQRRALQDGGHIDPNFWERYFPKDYPEPNCRTLGVE